MTAVAGRWVGLVFAVATPTLVLAQSVQTSQTSGAAAVAPATSTSASAASQQPAQPGLALIDQLNQAAQRLSYTGTYIHQQTSGVQGVYMAKIHQQVQAS
ncbi:MAG: hypothetical protein ACO3DF_01755, partial [Burkholderiaceae bacterium]